MPLNPLPGLDDYIRKAHGNAAKVLQAGGVWVQLMREVDHTFTVGGENIKERPGTIIGAFVFGSHSAWLAAANLALSAHLAESFQPLRSCLESAFYGYRIQSDPTAWDRWSTRPTVAHIQDNQNDASRLKRSRTDTGREFSVTSIARTLPSSASSLKDRALNLYDELIDHGAHFNFPALRRAFKRTGVGTDYYSSELKTLIANESDRVFCFTKLIQGGIAALELLDLAIGNEWPSNRIRSAIAGMTSRLSKRPKARLARRRSAT